MAQDAGAPMPQFTEEELRIRFTYHEPATEEQVDSYDRLRAHALVMARTINQKVPDSREKALALTKLEEVVMHANAGIARRS